MKIFIFCEKTVGRTDPQQLNLLLEWLWNNGYESYLLSEEASKSGERPEERFSYGN
jgi:hypothetical protein